MVLCPAGHDIGNWSFGEDSALSFIVAEKTERESELISEPPLIAYYMVVYVWAVNLSRGSDTAFLS